MADDISEAVKQFCNAAIEKGNFASPAKRDKALHTQLASSVKLLREKGVPGTIAFEELLKHESPHVRCWVASELLAAGITKAIPILDELSLEVGLLGTSARMVLQQYEAGRLRSPFGTNVA